MRREVEIADRRGSGCGPPTAKSSGCGPTTPRRGSTSAGHPSTAAATACAAASRRRSQWFWTRPTSRATRPTATTYEADVAHCGSAIRSLRRRERIVAAVQRAVGRANGTVALHEPRVRRQRMGLPQGVHRHRLGLLGRQVRRPLRARCWTQSPAPARGRRRQRHRGAARLPRARRRRSRRRGADARRSPSSRPPMRSPTAGRSRISSTASFRAARHRSRRRSARTSTRSRNAARRRTRQPRDRPPDRGASCRCTRSATRSTWTRSSSRRASARDMPVVEDAAESLGSQLQGPPHRRARRARGAELQRQQDRHHRRRRRDPHQRRGPRRAAPSTSRPPRSCRTPGPSSTTRSATTTACPTSMRRSGCAQLEQLDGFLERKRALAARYQRAFAGVSGVPVPRASRRATTSNYWLNAILLDEAHARVRDEMLAALNDAGLGARPAWTLMHRLPMFAACPRGDLPVAELLERRLINLPSSASFGPAMTDDAAGKICVVTGSRADYGLLLWPMRAMRATDRARSCSSSSPACTSPPSSASPSTRSRPTASRSTHASRCWLASDSARRRRQVHRPRRHRHSPTRSRGCAPDLVVLLGDRFEIFAAAQAASFCGIPVAHLVRRRRHRGRDRRMRSATRITQDVASAFRDQCRCRPRRLAPARRGPGAHLHASDQPGLDRSKRRRSLIGPRDLRPRVGMALGGRNVLVTFHPGDGAKRTARSAQLDELLAALDALDAESRLFFTLANADAEGRALNERIEAWRRAGRTPSLSRSLGQLRYISLMNQVDVVVGNSSSGLYEAPSLQRAQRRYRRPAERPRARRVGVPRGAGHAQAISAAIARGAARGRQPTVSPYGDGESQPAHRRRHARRSPDFARCCKKAFMTSAMAAARMTGRRTLIIAEAGVNHAGSLEPRWPWSTPPPMPAPTS